MGCSYFRDSTADGIRPMNSATRRRFLHLAGTVAAAVAGIVGSAEVSATPLPRLMVSDNGRNLVREDGAPFFYLGDTAWELFHRLNREEVVRYLDDRARKGFTVIQAVALAELDGLRTPNPYGHTPLVNLDPVQPDVRPGDENDYWDHVDFIVREANRRGLYIGFLPTWGDKWNLKWGVGPEIFTPANAERYGEWLGRRYRQAGLIWILGGDRPVESELHGEIIRAMARGLRLGDGGSHLMTFHPTGGSGSSTWFHEEAWLDFNMRQNGHVTEFTGRYDQTYVDYLRSPVKPVIDGEPIYEDHPIGFKPDELGHSVAADVRRTLYWNLFQGACGHTYGHHSVWQMWAPGREPVNRPLMPWYDAILQPGAGQMQHGRRLLESRPMAGRIPDPDLIITDLVPSSVPGAGRSRFVATRDEAGTWAMVYVPVGRTFSVRADRLQSSRLRAWWFNPRTGEATRIGEFQGHAALSFMPPEPGELLDWVLVLDDADAGYPPPGRTGH